MNNYLVNFISLIVSSSTLICCALPAVLVSLGAGASFASLIATFPFLITLSEFKIHISLFALLMILIAGYSTYRVKRLPCPSDPELGKVCLQTRQRSQYVYYFSLCLFLCASVFTYIIPHIA